MRGERKKNEGKMEPSLLSLKGGSRDKVRERARGTAAVMEIVFMARESLVLKY